MKASIEEIEILAHRSVNYFKLKQESFDPYWHFHPEIELTFILNGSGTRFVGDSIARYEKKDLVLVGSNLPHQWISENIHLGQQEAIVIQFAPSIFEAFPECNEIIDLLKKASRGLSFTHPPAFVMKSLNRFHTYNPIQQIGKLMDLLQVLAQQQFYTKLCSKTYALQAQKMQSPHKLKKVLNYILGNLNEKLTVSHMAEYTYMAPQSFCRWFKRNTGHSFITFLNTSRMEKATQLIKESDLSIKEIAYSCGFEHVSHFNRTFKRIKGIKPTSLR